MSQSTQRLNAWGQPLPPTLAHPPRILQRASPTEGSPLSPSSLSSPSESSSSSRIESKRRGRGAFPSSSPRGSSTPRGGSSSSRASRGSSSSHRSGAHSSASVSATSTHPPPPPRVGVGRGSSRSQTHTPTSREPEEGASLFDVITNHAQRQHHAKGRTKQNKQSKQLDPLAYIAATREAQAKQRRAAQQQANPNQASAAAKVKLRGKERETPKSKKPTKLKQAILADRETFFSAPDSPALHEQPHGEDEQEDTIHTPHEEEEEEEERQEDSDSNDNDQQEVHDAEDGHHTHTHTQHQPIDSSSRDTATGEPATGAEDLPTRVSSSYVPRIPPQCTVREYCDAVISPDLNASVSSLISQLYAYQLRAQQRDARKAKKRVVLGVREVQRSVQRRKSLCLIVTYNIERTAPLNQATTELIHSARQQAIPVVFALKKADLAKAIGKRMHMAFASIVNVDGAHEAFRAMLQLAQTMRDEKHLIDEWLLAEQRNDAGDPLGTPYAKHPLLNPSTGVFSDRYRYLIQRYPQRPWRCPSAPTLLPGEEPSSVGNPTHPTSTLTPPSLMG